MSTLSGILSIANQSLQAQQTGLDVVANNIANVNTTGYSRQVANLVEQAPFQGASSGGGVAVDSIQSVRDSVLEIRLNQENSTQGSLTSMQQQLAPVEAMFSTSGGAGLGTAIDGFFSSLQQLSTDPSSGSQRQAVISAAGTMAQTFQQVAGGLSQQQAGADQEVVQGVSQVNALLTQIAGLNTQVAEAENSQQNPGAIIDQRTNAMRSLSSLMSFNVSAGSNGQLTLTTASGGALVVGSTAAALTTQTAPTGVQDVMLAGTDVTAAIASSGGGSLAGDIQARDQVLPQLSAQLDQLASGLATAVNAQNALGYTPAGVSGGNLFTAPPATGAAKAMALATTDPNAIAASGDGTPGDNTNVLALEGLQQQTIAGGQTPDTAYAGIVSGIGSTIAAANTQQQASQLVLTQLQNQRDAVSGVSLDQESIQLQQFQSAYEAAARVVTTLNTLASLAVNLGKD
ncbi:MAG TPA: flagellar hook-associated protein FlgK [Terriglobales bacterium]|nr:flagellar hook-associated protein FlgK [Terriglobales bacterium]